VSHDPEREKIKYMRNITLLLSMMLVAGVLGLSTARKHKNLSAAIGRIQRLYVKKTASLDSFLAAYPAYFYDSSYTIREKKFEELCFYFKQSAGFIAYFEPDLYTNELVGPFRFHKSEKKGFFSAIKNDWLFQGPIGNEPDSLLLKDFSRQDSIDQKEFIVAATADYRKALTKSRYQQHLSGMTDTVLFDALRKEIFRISAIDLANSDFYVDEAATPSLKGSIDIWVSFVGEIVAELPAEQAGLAACFDRLSAGARQMIEENPDYRTLDRMLFTRKYLIPLSRLLSELQVVFDVPFLTRNSAINPDAQYLYDKDIFNINYFAIDSNGYYTPEKAALGELLFFDPILSDNNKRACASCHKPSMAFTDGNIKSVSFQFSDLPRNSPTVINAVFQRKLFWDLRAGSLEDQLDSVVNNKNELHSSFPHVIEKLNASPQYIAAFARAFPASKRTGITRKYIKCAIAVYERSLTGLNSRFDQYMRGDDSKLTQEEISGFNLFMGKAKCGVCHFAPLFNGSMPPYFDLSDHHSLGVPVKDSMIKYVVDRDVGLMKMSGDAFDRFSFKVPTVRNAALTAPYMHNGIFKTLDQVVDFYDHAAGNKFTRDMRPDMIGLPFFTILPIELRLSIQEKNAVVAFIRSLTDTTASSGVPSTLPNLNPPFGRLNKRTIGGDY
jgi:cytochrome c peroxidase